MISIHWDNTGGRDGWRAESVTSDSPASGDDPLDLDGGKLLATLATTNRLRARARFTAPTICTAPPPPPPNLPPLLPVRPGRSQDMCNANRPRSSYVSVSKICEKIQYLFVMYSRRYI